MLDAHTRLCGIFAWYKARYSDQSDVAILQKIDAKIVHVLVSTIDTLPIQKEQLLGFAEMVEAIDEKLDSLGVSEFKESEKVKVALSWIKKPTTPVDKILDRLQDPTGWIALRNELWEKTSG